MTAATEERPRIMVGDTIEVDEEDYEYGRGVLRLELTEIIGPWGQEIKGVKWIRVRGCEVYWDGMKSIARTHRIRPGAARIYRKGPGHAQ